MATFADVMKIEKIAKIRDSKYNCFYTIKVNNMYYAGIRNGKALFTENPSGAWEVSKSKAEAEQVKNILNLKDVFGDENFSQIIKTKAYGLKEIPIVE